MPYSTKEQALGKIAERFCPTDAELGETDIFCTYCVLSLEPAVKSCLHCEASLCDTHLRLHSKSGEHVLTGPTTSFIKRKCSVHKGILEYFCCEDGVGICVFCCLTGEHRGHNVESLNEASEKKKDRLSNVLEELSLKRDETERESQNMQECRRRVAEKAAGETERVIAMFRDIREQLKVLEKGLLSDISRKKEELSLQLCDLIQQLEIKKDELSRKIHHIKELFNMADPLSVLQEWESDQTAFWGAEGGDRKRRNIQATKFPVVGDMDVDQISETLLTGLAGIVTGVEEWYICGQEAKDLLLDKETAWNNISVSGDRKCATNSRTQEILQYPQALSTKSFPSGRHYWEVEGSKLGSWRVGVAYPSIEREGFQSWIDENNKSWCLYRHSKYTAKHDQEETVVTHVPSCRRIRISLVYEAGRLSFYELSEPIRHLHNFTATFTEPLHAAFWVWGIMTPG
ncbi:hypothetical protein XELAEV_18010917mg [Xenopus laevis]|uniref:B30.2/SPRY domain-containing protein n=1 Tax=Xenopus laevis TaxID=8355 RepID=A0A974DWS0_XENLA|nr:hypothetical protein XELAEV_18010917mg [Xenopus laevis]